MEKLGRGAVVTKASTDSWECLLAALPIAKGTSPLVLKGIWMVSHNVHSRYSEIWEKWDAEFQTKEKADGQRSLGPVSWTGRLALQSSVVVRVTRQTLWPNPCSATSRPCELSLIPLSSELCHFQNGANNNLHGVVLRIKKGFKKSLPGTK